MEGKRGSECLLKSVSNIDFNPGGMVAIIQKRLVTCHVAGTDVDLTQTKPDTYLADLAAGTKPLFQVSYDPRNIQLVKYGFKVGTDYVVPTINSPKAKASEAVQDL
ncbi:phage-related minor capsid protein [Lentilactobacillus parakefiri]|uniref:Phage-related minor capsid protein n=1 Tax=Lentilactobacillus parakefiri TaxID=152332 RepID=A0A224VDH9_9LACO|nr:phage-related minor capsid protein [Lentilactobacillus parakefiri]